MNVNKKRKLRSGIIAALLMLLILLTGTYAWTQFNNVGFNAMFTETNFGGRFHDNFVWEHGSNGIGEGAHNKDLFAENFGKNRIFVRARLREFMTSGGVSVIEGTTIDNPLGVGVDAVEWPIYVSEPDNPHIRRVSSETAAFERNGIEWNLGHHTDKVFMPTFNHAQYRVDVTEIDGSVPPLFAHEDAFEMIEATGKAVDGHTLDITAQTEAGDILDNGSQTGPGLMGHTDSDINTPMDEHGEHDYWDEGDTMLSPRLIVDENGLLQAINDPDTSLPFEHEARYTLSPENPTRNGVTLAHPVTNGVMTMQQWRQLESPRGDFWVLDTDGWFYWASPLESEDATSLLLDEIIVEDRRGEGIEYVINVETEFTNWTNIEIAPELDDMSEDAVALWMNQNIDIPDTAHETFQDPETGTLWRVLVPVNDPRGGVGNALIITEYTHNNGITADTLDLNPTSEPIFVMFEDSRQRQIMLDWYEDDHFVGRSMRAISLDYQFGALDMIGASFPRTEPGAGIEFEWISMADGPWVSNVNILTHAGIGRPQAFARPTGQPGNGEPFSLSISEVLSYFPDDLTARDADYVGGLASTTWILRTPGDRATGDAQGPYRSIAGGVIASTGLNLVNPRSQRPALWVRAH